MESVNNIFILTYILITSMKAKLRGHHLICLNFFRGEGYSEDFIKNIYSVMKKEKVEIVKGADDVCARWRRPC